MECEFDGDPRALNDYRQYVKGKAEAGRSEVFLNRNIEHAAIIVEFLIALAQERVEILSAELNRHIYGDPQVIHEVSSFLDRTWTPFFSVPTLSILVENTSGLNGHPLLARLGNAFSLGQAELRRVPEAVKDTYPFHFIVTDGKHYRCNTSRELSEAVVQFNAPETGEKFHSIFQNIRPLSDVINPLELM
jgi:hypothetical protein